MYISCLSLNIVVALCYYLLTLIAKSFSTTCRKYNLHLSFRNLEKNVQLLKPFQVIVVAPSKEPE